MFQSFHHSHNYKPLPNRTPFLAFFTILTLLLIALIEVAFRTLPKAVAPIPISMTLNVTNSEIDAELPAAKDRTGSEPKEDECEGEDPPEWCYLYGILPPPPEAVPTVASKPNAAMDSTTQLPSTALATPSRSGLPSSPRYFGTTPPSLKPRAHNSVVPRILSKYSHQWPTPSNSTQPHYWTIPKGLYSVACYLPVLAAVVFGALWNIADTSIKRMEPFYQLASPSGAIGATSLTAKTRTSGIGKAAYRAIYCRQWVVVLSSAIRFLATLIVPLSSEMIFINIKAICTKASPSVAHCLGKLLVSNPIARTIEGLLACIVVLTSILAGMMWGRRSGVYADPSSIAGLATLLQNQEMLTELRQLDPWISDDDLTETLAGERFRIGHFRNSDGIDGYGFTIYKGQIGIPKTEALDQRDSKTSFSTNYGGGKITNSTRQKPNAHRSLWLHPASVVAFSVTLIGIQTLVTFYHTRGEDTGFKRFMDSQGCSFSFLVTGMGVLVKSFWSNIEEEIRTLEPYRNLTLGPCLARDTILVALKSTPITALPSAIIRVRPFLAILAFNTILSDILTVALSSVPYRGQSISITYSSSAILTISITSFMLATLLWVATRDTRLLDLPRRPDSIASVLVYLCGGSIVRNFQGMAMVEGKVRDEVIVEMGKRYWLGKVLGVDGEERVGFETDDEVDG